MASSISSAEPEKLLRYSEFGVRLDWNLIQEANRLAATLLQFEASCTEPGFQVGVSHLGEALRSYGASSESDDLWVGLVGRGFQIADGMWRGLRFSPGRAAHAAWSLPALAWGAITLAALLPTIPAWLKRLRLSLPWLRDRSARKPETSRSPEQVAEVKRSGSGEVSKEPSKAKPESTAGNIQKVYDVIRKLDVEHNERYRAGRQGQGETYCNIYAMDYAREMGAPLPEELKGKDGTYDYLDANEAVMWLRGDYQDPEGAPTGPAQGWKSVNANRAAELASKGYVVIAGWQDPKGGAGHMAIVRPDSQPGAIRIAQAGANNFSNGTLSEGFKNREPIEFFVYMPN